MQALTRCSCQKQMTGLLEYDAASPSLEPNRKAPLLLVLYRFSAFRTHGPSSNQVTPVHRADGSQRSLVNECRAAGGDLSADRAQPGDRRGRIEWRRRGDLSRIEQIIPSPEKVVLILHDWGSALGFDWANRHRDRAAAIIYMEGIVRPIASWASGAVNQTVPSGAG